MKETTTFDETLINFIERKHPRKGERKRKQRGKDRRSPGKQTAQQRWATSRKGNH
jgi:hypothetical protein